MTEQPDPVNPVDAVMYLRQGVGEGKTHYTGQYLLIMGVLAQCLAKREKDEEAAA